MEGSNVILTQHPEGKKGVCISRTDYRLVSEAILSVLQQFEKLTLNELIDQVQRSVSLSLSNNIAWRILVVKLDLEAKGLIKTVPHKFDRYVVYLKLNRKAWKKTYHQYEQAKSAA
jgi:hypothetical protein